MDKYKYAAIKELGICTKCGKNKAEAGKTMCAACKEEKRVSYEFYKENKICVVCRHEKAVPGKTRCSFCARYKAVKKYDPEKSRAIYLKQKEIRAEQGLCINCGARPKQHGSICNLCWTTRLIRSQYKLSESRSERVSNKHCYTCGAPELVPGKRICPKCYEKRLAAVVKATETRHKKMEASNG